MTNHTSHLSNSRPSAASAALDHVRSAVAICRKGCEELIESGAGRPIRTVGIVGAGIMGAAIAREHVVRGLPVVLVDSSTEALRHAAGVCTLAERGTPSDAGRVCYSLSQADLAGCDLVLETIAEKRPAKQLLYGQLAPQLADGGILATNTSSIPITRLASGLAAPARFCGLHFCHPIRRRPLVEIIPGAATSTNTLAAVVAHALYLGKLPLVVGDGPGFVVNRLLMSYLTGAVDLLVAGMRPRDIDAAMIGFGMPMGPLAQLDEIGIDTALHSAMVLGEVNTDRSDGAELLVALVRAGHLGVKSGTGIYTYPDGVVNQSVDGFVDARQERAEPTNGKLPDHRSLAAELLRPMVIEAGRLLAAKNATAAWQIDLATIFGLGFPCWRGGLHWWSENGS